MIKGRVNEREARVRLTVLGPIGRQREIEAVVDTGYTASLSLPPSVIEQLGLRWQSLDRGTLADGSECLFDVAHRRPIRRVLFAPTGLHNSDQGRGPPRTPGDVIVAQIFTPKGFYNRLAAIIGACMPGSRAHRIRGVRTYLHLRYQRPTIHTDAILRRGPYGGKFSCRNNSTI